MFEKCCCKVELFRRSGTFEKDGKEVSFSVLYIRLDDDVEIKVGDVDPAVKSLLSKYVPFKEVKEDDKDGEKK